MIQCCKADSPQLRLAVISIVGILATPYSVAVRVTAGAGISIKYAPTVTFFKKTTRSTNKYCQAVES